MNNPQRRSATATTARLTWPARWLAAAVAAGGPELCRPAPRTPPPALRDLTPPTAPTGLSLTRATPTQLSFRWTASTDNVGVVRYQVFRGTVQVGEPTGTSFTLGDLKPSTSYTITVRALDAAKNKSAVSAPLVATTTHHHRPRPHRARRPQARQRHRHQPGHQLDGQHRQRRRHRLPGLQQRRLGGHRHQPEVPDDRPPTAGKAYALSVRAMDAVGNVSASSATPRPAPCPPAPWW